MESYRQFFNPALQPFDSHFQGMDNTLVVDNAGSRLRLPNGIIVGRSLREYPLSIRILVQSNHLKIIIGSVLTDILRDQKSRYGIKVLAIGLERNPHKAYK